MKKSTRILSVILALTMLLGMFSVMGSAYQAYRDGAITAATGRGYDDLDKPTFTTEQYASMALEELEKLLASANIYLGPDDLLNLTDEGLDLRSINKAIASVAAIYENVSGLLSIAGDAGSLSIDALYVGHQKSGGLVTRGVSGNTQDKDVILAVVRFLEDNKGILTGYVAHTLSLGALNSLVSDYLFDVRALAFKALYHVMNDSYDILDGEIDANNKIEGKYNVTSGSGDLDVMLYDLLKYALIGNHQKVNGAYVLPDPEDYEGFLWEYLEDLSAAEIDQILSDCNINANTSAYNFIEKLMVNAFNYIAVPVLNNVTRPWLREVCGVTYDKDKMDPNSANYDPDYDGEYQPGDLDPQLAAIFDVDGMHIPAYNPSDYAANSTFIANFNTYFGGVLECVLNGSAANGDWDWDNSQGDALLLKNICSVARFILKGAGDKFFEPYITLPSSEEIGNMNDQQTVAFVLRVILNESVSWMYIDDTQQTIADVCYAAVEQLAWQDLPQLSYTKPVRGNSTDAQYYAALVDQMLDILMDIAAYNINNNIDMVANSNGKMKNRTATNPATNAGSGLLEYCNDYETLAIQIATWGVHNYAGMLTATGCAFENLNTDPNNNGTVGNVTAAQVWADLDTIINALVPIKGASAWIHNDISSQTLVIKSLLFDYIIYPILNINDVSNFEKIFSRNTNGELATNTTKKAIIDLVTRVVNTIFPGTVTKSFASLDALVVNSELATIVGNLIDSLYAHASDWIAVALPVVCDLLNLTDAQKFGEMECYMPEIVSVSEATAGLEFQVYNGSSGINTGYTNSNGAFTQDNLYVYEIVSITATTTSGSVGVTGLAAGQTLAGGAAKSLTIAGSGIKKDSIITLNIVYKVKNETNQYLADGAELACTRYCYVDTTNKDDSDERIDYVVGNYTLKAAPTVYANRGRSLDDILGYSVAVKDDAGNSQTIRISSISTNVPWITQNTEATLTTDASAGMTYSLTPFKLADGYVRLNESYNVANVNSGNFETYGNTDENPTTRATDLYTRNANGYTYTLVPQSAAYDASETYYTLSTNAVNGTNVDAEGNTIISNGTFTASYTLATPSGNITKSVKFFLYDDKGLASLYENAVDANRQPNNFTNANTEYNTYKSALDAAGLLVLDPKTEAEFPTKSAQYATAYGNLYAAIKALDEKAATTGTTALEQAIAGFVANSANNGANYSNNYYLDEAEDVNPVFMADGNEPEKVGWNNVQYWATTAGGTNGPSRYAYSYFGIRDYVGHDYKKFRDARNSAQSIIDSQVVYPPIEPVNPGADASVYEYNKYVEAMEAYNAEYESYLVRVANIPALNSVSVAYALSMVNLTGNRLIPRDANTSKLAAFRSAYSVDAQGNYSASTWEEYTLAKTFADYTLSDPAPKPEQITEALSQYVRAYKRLCMGVDYTVLDAAIIDALSTLAGESFDIGGVNPSAIAGAVASVIDTLDTALSDANEIKEAFVAAGYTAESSEAFANAVVEAIDIRKADLGDSTANQNTVANAAAALTAAINGLVIAAGADPVIEFFDIETDPDAYEEALANSVFYRDDFGAAFVPYADSTYGEMYYGDADMYFIAGIGVFYYDGEPTDVFKTLENCYAVWTPNEMDCYSTASYITIYADENETDEIANYYVVLYGDFDGDAEITAFDTFAVRSDAEEYMWDGEMDHFVMACSADVDGDFEATSIDALILKSVSSGSSAINQDFDNHWGYGDEGAYIDF
ncbi:MAG: hypothetical protein IJK60_07130 [Clostridia bacterium]|nr:hypothetical protein [Clostridia bacterium]